MAAKTVSGGVKGQARKAAAKYGARVVSKHVSKAAGKSVLRAASSPWLLAADAGELATEAVLTRAGCDATTTKVVSKGVGLGGSVAIGAAVAGPVGAAAGAALWGVGELVGSLVD